MRAARSCYPAITLLHLRRTAVLHLRSTAVILMGLAGCAAADELPLSRVVLSSAGLAQFTHSGSITGGATVDLSVRLHQVDDILKSLTVFDKEGAIGAVALPGRAPLEELFRDLPFGPDALEFPDGNPQRIGWQRGGGRRPG